MRVHIDFVEHENHGKFGFVEDTTGVEHVGHEGRGRGGAGGVDDVGDYGGEGGGEGIGDDCSGGGPMNVSIG